MGGGGGGSNNANQEALAAEQTHIFQELDPTSPTSPLNQLSGDTMALFNQLSPVNVSGGQVTGLNPNSPANDAGVTQLKSIAQELLPSMTTGQLPPGEENIVANAQNDATAGLRGRYAAMGLSGSTMEAQDEGAVASRAAGQRAQLAQQATQLGMSAETSYQDIQSMWYSLAQGTLQADTQIYTAFTQAALSAAGGASSNYSSLAQQRLQADQAQEQQVGEFATAAAALAMILI